jgi:predicted nuclease of predicted toxin-antitoxin system
MRVLVDVSAGPGVAAELNLLGHDVAEVANRDPRMDDTDVLAWSVAEDRVVVTIDTDFGELVFHHGHRHAGVVRFVNEGISFAEVLRQVRYIFINHADQLPGQFVVCEYGRIRVRSSP